MVKPVRPRRRLDISLTDHAARRIRQRRIPPHAVWEAIEQPFVRLPLPDGRQLGAVAATVGGRWTWVQVVTEPIGVRRYRVVTVFSRLRRGRTGPRLAVSRPGASA